MLEAYQVKISRVKVFISNVQILEKIDRIGEIIHRMAGVGIQLNPGGLKPRPYLQIRLLALSTV